MTLEPRTFRGRIDGQGNLVPSEVGKYRGFLSRFKDRAVEITIAPERKAHTHSQRGWYRAAIVPEVAAFLSEAKGYVISKEQAHELLKQAFIGINSVDVAGVVTVYGISTKTLDPAAFSDYCTKILAHFAELGLVIATPEDYWGERVASR